ncbi:DUF1801 domain-containing protein [Flavivirga abyssicola]|uniref:DUF1801 domain-containing protein n=1 Tax=Flavivirga abyssicola TaxID=3063533 RepID=UPI0026DECDBD|nr:DUF1801 domain-containing protein [Flavivirga sp. MEBiC07777]WVK13825.1 DUF1801 domain-containing protein [Flavivirga sp. MEBiC07777]
MMLKEIDDYFLNQNEQNRECLLALRDIVLSHNQFLTESVKYKTPVFKYRESVFCYLWVDKKTNEPCLLIEEGKQLNHPDLEQTNHRSIALLRINPQTDLPMESIKSILSLSLKWHQEKENP